MHMLVSFVNSRQAALWGSPAEGCRLLELVKETRLGIRVPVKEAVPKKCFQANKPSHFLLTNADTKRAPNIPRMREMLPSLSCGLAGTLLGHLAPSVCAWEKPSQPAECRGAARSERGHKSHSREQETRTRCRNNTSVHGETGELACMTDINQSPKSAAELGESRIKCSPG